MILGEFPRNLGEFSRDLGETSHMISAIFLHDLGDTFAGTELC